MVERIEVDLKKNAEGLFPYLKPSKIHDFRIDNYDRDVVIRYGPVEIDIPAGIFASIILERDSVIVYSTTNVYGEWGDEEPMTVRIADKELAEKLAGLKKKMRNKLRAKRAV